MKRDRGHAIQRLSSAAISSRCGAAHPRSSPTDSGSRSGIAKKLWAKAQGFFLHGNPRFENPADICLARNQPWRISTTCVKRRGGFVILVGKPHYDLRPSLYA